MLNKQNNKLDEQIKNSLSNYEASETGNWSRMEEMLNANAKTNRPIWLSVTVGVLAIAGAYFIYENVTSEDKMDAKSSSSFNKEVIMPVVTKTESVKPTDVTPLNDLPVAASERKVAPAKVLTKEEYKAKSERVKKEIDEIVKKENASEKINTVKAVKQQSVTVMGKDAVFPEMIDGKKGIVNPTRESKEMQEKAVKVSSVIPSIQWIHFINKDGKRDSIRKTE